MNNENIFCNLTPKLRHNSTMETKTKLSCSVKTATNPRLKVITFDPSALPALCRMLKVPFDPDIVAFTKTGIVKKGLLNLIKLSDTLK